MSGEILKFVSQLVFIGGSPFVENPDYSFSPLSLSAAIVVAQTRFVTKGGNDATGDGSFGNPFLTVQAAITSITDATLAKPYTIQVAAGVYATTFRLSPFIFINGAGGGTSESTGAPLNGATVLAPDPVQILAASFAGAGNLATGIVSCSFSTALLCDFNAIGSTGAGTFLLNNVYTDSAMTFVGNNIKHLAMVNNVINGGIGDLTFTNIGTSDTSNYLSDEGSNVNYNQSAAMFGTHNLTGSLAGNVVATWTSALLANNMTIFAAGQFANANPVISGNGVIFLSNCSFSAAIPDAATRISFGLNVANIIAIGQGTNVLSGTPTANRVLTIDRPTGVTTITTIVIRNLSTAFNYDLTFPAGTLAPGMTTYVPPSSEATIRYDKRNNTWYAGPIVQGRTVALVNGVSPAITADITANSRITATLVAFTGAIGTISVSNKTVGTRAGGGSYTLTSINAATGATVATDGGSYDSLVANSGG